MKLYDSRNIHQKMLSVQESDNQSELIREYVSSDANFKWLIEVIKEQPKYGIDYEKEIAPLIVDYSEFDDGIFGGLNEMFAKMTDTSVFTMGSTEHLTSGYIQLNHSSMKILKELYKNKDREKLIDFISSMMHPDEMMFLIDVLNSESQWLSEEIINQI